MDHGQGFQRELHPYEVVLGLKPRLLLDAQLVVPSFVKKLPVEEYVKDLVAYLKKVRQHVAEQHQRVRDHEHCVKEARNNDYRWETSC